MLIFQWVVQLLLLPICKSFGFPNIKQIENETHVSDDSIEKEGAGWWQKFDEPLGSESYFHTIYVMDGSDEAELNIV